MSVKECDTLLLCTSSRLLVFESRIVGMRGGEVGKELVASSTELARISKSGGSCFVDAGQYVEYNGRQ